MYEGKQPGQQAFSPPISPNAAGAQAVAGQHPPSRGAPPPGIPGRPVSWPTPAPSNFWLLGGALGLAVLAGATLLDAPGLQWPVLAIGLALLARYAVRSPAPVSAADRWWRRVFIGLALALIATMALRDSGALMVLQVFAAVTLTAVALIPSGRLLALVSAPVLGVVAWARGMAWLPMVPRTTWKLSATAVAAVRGSALAGLLLIVVGWLLGSADQAFAGLTGALLPDLDLDYLPARLVTGGLMFCLVAAVAFGVAAPPAVFARPIPRRRPRVEWAIPLLVLLALLGLFLVVQAAVLFDAYPAELVSGDLTPAERARQGFGQLVCVTIVVVAILAWSGSRAAERDRRLLILVGAPLLAEVLVLVASALRRMYLYEETFGFTVLRVEVAVFEVWLALAVLVAAGLWLTGRSAAVPRVSLASAGLVLLALALIGPDAIVARASVQRFHQTGKIDGPYLSGLSADAVPALAELPEPERSCALYYSEPGDTPWYAVNLSRLRADALLAARPVADSGCPGRS